MMTSSLFLGLNSLRYKQLGPAGLHDVPSTVSATPSPMAMTTALLLPLLDLATSSPADPPCKSTTVASLLASSHPQMWLSLWCPVQGGGVPVQRVRVPVQGGRVPVQGGRVPVHRGRVPLFTGVGCVVREWCLFRGLGCLFRGCLFRGGGACSGGWCLVPIQGGGACSGGDSEMMRSLPA